MVEFVLILFPLIVFVGGIIQLGIGIANWHDLNRIANEGARYAATEAWPGCAGTQPTCTLDPADCQPPPPSDPVGRSLDNYLRCEARDAGLPLSGPPEVCYPVGSTPVSGKPVTVRLASRTDFLSIDDIDQGTIENKVEWLGIDLSGEATMRLEKTPTKYTLSQCT